MSRPKPARYCTLLLLLVISATAAAEEIRVRLEPFPPLILENGGGPVVAMLKEAAAGQDLNLDIRTVSYSRARYQLRNGEADLIGLVPLERETPDFYDYARELNWHVEARADLFSHSPALLEGEGWREHRIGTPWGNAAFFSDMTGLSVDRFVESSLPSLARMLRSQRIDLLLFARMSTMETMADLGLEGIHYRNLYEIPAGFAVADTERGQSLAQRLDALLAAPGELTGFEDYVDYTELPSRGVVGKTPLPGPD